MREDSQVKKNSSAQLSGFARIALIAVLVLIVALVIGFVVYWQPKKTVQRQQATLIKAIEKRKAARIRRLISGSYKDRWGFTPEDATEAMLDTRSQFLVLAVKPVEDSLTIDGKKGIFQARFETRRHPDGSWWRRGEAEIQSVERTVPICLGKTEFFAF